MDKYYVLRASRMFNEPCSVPSRIILVKIYEEDGTFREYATYVECTYEEGKTSNVWGHYHTPFVYASANIEKARKDADEDFEKRMSEFKDFVKSQVDGTTIRLPVIEDSGARLPEDNLFDMESQPEIFRTFPSAQPHTCMECAWLHEYNTTRMIDVCEAHRNYLQANNLSVGSQHQRHDAEKIIPRQCREFRANDKPPGIVKLRVKLVKAKLEGTNRFTGD